MSEHTETAAKPCTSKSEFKQLVILPCPFCGETPELPDGFGTQYDIECDCGRSRSGVQICDLMTIEERMADEFTDYRYGEEYITRARDEAIEAWNKRVNNWPEWIDLKIKLPKKCEPVLLLFKNGAKRTGQYVGDGKFDPYGYLQVWTLKPTHWVSLPEAI